MRFFALLTAGLAAVADAYHRPVGNPKGNPIYTPSLQQQVHKGSPFKITWKPTTEGTVTLVLLRGPSTNVKPIHVIAHKIPNNGHHEWIPNMNLEVDNTHYGLQLIVDRTGQYQYSTQFGIAKPKKHGGNGGEIVGSGSDSTVSISGPESKSVSTYTTVVSSFTTYCPFATTVPVNNNTTYTVTGATTLTVTDCPCTLTHTGPAPTYPAGNATSTHSWATYTPPHNTSSTTSHSMSHSTVSISHHITPTTTPPSYTTTGGSTPSQPTSSPTETVPSGASTMYSASFAAGLFGLVAAVVGL